MDDLRECLAAFMVRVVCSNKIKLTRHITYEIWIYYKAIYRNVQATVCSTLFWIALVDVCIQMYVVFGH